MRLSAVVLCFNEVHSIRACIESLSFCDEVIVVDDCSTDGTWELLQTLPVRAVRHRHTTFAEQREFGASLASGGWLLTMDADERVNPALRTRILGALDSQVDGFYLRRRNPFPPPLRGHNWTRHPRLVRRAKCRWQKTDSPHAPLDVSGLTFGELRGVFLDHEPVKNLPTLFRKAINRSLIVAAQGRARGKRAGVGKLLFSPIARFFKFLIIEGAWAHGFSGIAMSLAAAYEAFCKQAFMAELPESLIGFLDGGAGSYAKDAEILDPSTRTD